MQPGSTPPFFMPLAIAIIIGRKRDLLPLFDVTARRHVVPTVSTLSIRRQTDFKCRHIQMWYATFRAVLKLVKHNTAARFQASSLEYLTPPPFQGLTTHWLPTFRDSLSVSPSRVKQPTKLTPRNIAEDWRRQATVYFPEQGVMKTSNRHGSEAARR
jgi:hypothetical protein